MKKKGVDFVKKNIALGIFCFFALMSVISQILPYISLFFDAPTENSFAFYVLMFFCGWLMDIIVILTLTTIAVLTIRIIFKHSNALNFVRYTYEEYKVYREQKKTEKQAEKQAKKRAKMEAQRQRLDSELQEMEKTE